MDQPENQFLRESIPSRFEIRDRLGSGAFGAVYRAFDQKHQMIIALKTLHRVEPTQLLHLKREFRSLTRISHPNLVDLYELIARGDCWFFTMDYVEGVDFRRALVGGDSVGSEPTVEGPPQPTLDVPEEPAETLDCADPDNTVGIDWAALGSGGNQRVSPPAAPQVDIPLLRRLLGDLVVGVNALHEYGKIHRDLKPENVMVTPEEEVKILDFGLVTELDQSFGEEADQEKSGESLAGTPAFLPPELATQSSLRPSADWYSLGVMLYETFTGAPPFSGLSPIQELFQKNDHPAPDVRERAGAIPEDLAQLCMDLLAIEPEDRPTGPEILSRLGMVAPQGDVSSMQRAAPNRGRAFVGRDRELEGLHEIYRETFEGGSPSLVNVCGGSGVGKSALVEQFLSEVGSTGDATLIRGRCFENESVPYKAIDGVIDQLVPLLRERSVDEVEEVLGEGASAVAQLFPVLRRLEAVARAEVPFAELPNEQRRQQAFHALGRLLELLGQTHRLVIFIDDVQWGDQDSALLLRGLLTRPEPPRLMLVTTWREDTVETSPFLGPFRELQEDLREVARIEDFELSELSVEESRQLAEQLFNRMDGSVGDQTRIDQQVDKIVQEARGNPLFVDEFTRRAVRSGRVDSGIQRFADILFDRVAEFSDAVRAMLEVVAVAGQPIDREVAVEAAGVEAEGLSGMSRLLSGRLVRSMSGERVTTYHDRIRAALVEQLSEGRRRRMHRDLAETWEGRSGSDPETIAVHFVEAGEEVRAAEYLLKAARIADEALAFERAIQLLEQALELGDWERERRYQIRRRCGELYAALGRGRPAAEAFSQAAKQGDGLDVRDCRVRMAQQLLRGGAFQQGTDLLYDELEELGFSAARSRPAMLASIAYRRWKLGRRGLDFELREPSEIPRRQRLLIDALTSATLMFGVSDVIRGTYFHYHALMRALETGYPSRLTGLLCQQVAQDSADGSMGERAAIALSKAKEVWPRCRKDRRNMRSFIAFMEGMIEYFGGRWRSALRSIERSVEIVGGGGPGHVWEQEIFQYFETDCLERLGQFDEMRQKVPQFLDRTVDREDGFNAFLYRTKLVKVMLVDDEADRAEREIERARRDWGRDGYHIHHFRLLHAAVETALYRGEGEAAFERVTEEWWALKGSLLLLTEQTLLDAWSLHGRAAVARLGEVDGWRGWRARFTARRAIGVIRGAEDDWADGFADGIEARLAYLNGEEQRAIDCLESAAERFADAEMEGFRWAARLRRGQIEGGAGGEEQIGEARAALEELGVRNPEAMARLLDGGGDAHERLAGASKT